MTKLHAAKGDVHALIARAITEGRDLLQDAKELTDEPSYKRWTEDCERWDARTKAALESVLRDSDLPDEFHAAATGSVFRVVGQQESETLEYRREAIARGINTLRSIDERLEFLPEPAAAPLRGAGRRGGRQVFIVHGRDAGLRDQVARLVERLGLQSIILGEQTDEGRTIIEKFEEHALDAGYAVALLTPDDLGRNPEDGAWPGEPNRARQNVLLELGYFMGALGRRHVAALHVPGTELPSDIHGLLYISVADEWQLRLAKEMKAAGLPIDLNRL